MINKNDGINRNKNKQISETIVKVYRDDEEAFKQVEQSALENELSSSFSRKSKVVFPFLNFIIDNTSKVYNDPVSRDIDEKNRDNKNLQKLFKIAVKSFEEVAVIVDKYTNMTGMTGVKPHYNSQLDKFKYHVFTSNQIDFTPNAEDSSEYDEIIINYVFDNSSQSEIWRNNTYTLYTEDIIKEEGENIYNQIPFVFFKNDNDNLEFYGKPKKNVLETQNMLSKILINTDATFKMQSNSILLVKGINDINAVKTGPFSINHVPDDASLEYVNPDVDLEQMINYLTSQFQLMSQLNGIPDSLFSSKQTSSGVSIVASQKVLIDFIKQRQKIFINKEKEAIILGIKVLAEHKNIKIPDDFDILIKYKYIAEPLSDNDLKQWNFAFANKLYSPVDFIMSQENITREEAEAKLEQTKEDFDKFFKKEENLLFN